MRVGFATVVYPASLPYFNDFFQSLNNQEDSDFDLLIFLDGLNEDQVSSIVESANIKIKYFNVCKGTISDIRLQMLEECLRLQYDLLILGDSDDSFSANRVSRYRENFDENITIYYNQLRVNGKAMFLDLPIKVTSHRTILESNFLGLSNTAINLNKISNFDFLECSNMPKRVFDWYFFTILLFQNHKAKRVDNCFSNYRVHSSNIAGDKQTESLELKVKLEHYCSLVKYNPIFLSLYEAYLKGEYKKSIDSNSYWWSNFNVF